MSVTDQRGKASQWPGSLWAGVGSAVICYANTWPWEPMLAPALLGYGAQSKSVGTLLVVASAALACLLLAWRKVPYLAGPRGLYGGFGNGIALAAAAFPASAAAQVALLVTLLFAALGCRCWLQLPRTSVLRPTTAVVGAVLHLRLRHQHHGG